MGYCHSFLAKYLVQHRGNNEAAKDHFELAIAENPGKAQYHRNLGNVSELLGDYQLAEVSYYQAYSLAHSSCNLKALVRYLVAHGKFESAKDLYDEHLTRKFDWEVRQLYATFLEEHYPER